METHANQASYFLLFHELELGNRNLGHYTFILPRFNPLDTPANLDESASKIKDALYDIVKLAEIQESMKILLEVMATKKRQMNRLQFKILPELDSTIRYIELILEETERQDAIRVRVLQRKRKERASKHT